jgi:hypothetical protein
MVLTTHLVDLLRVTFAVAMKRSFLKAKQKLTLPSKATDVAPESNPEYQVQRSADFLVKAHANTR